MTQFTEKQRQFIANKVAGCSNRDAALSAGYAVSGAAVAADKLMKHPGVRAAIKAATKSAPSVDIKSSMPTMPRDTYADSMAFLVDVMNLPGLPIVMRADAAKQLLPYQHAKMGEVGKKETAKNRAGAIAGTRGKFTAKLPPQLRIVE